MHARGRVNRWWVRAFALLGFAVCVILPLGAIGTIDASFDSSVAVPLSRSAGRNLAEQAERAVVDRGTLHATDGHRLIPASVRALQAPAPAAAAALVATFVLLALVAPVAPPFASRPQPGLPRRRGPPASR